MRPADIYTLPTQEAEAWHENYGTLADFFDDESLDYQLDREAGARAGTAELSLERKLHAYVDHRTCPTYTAVTFRGAPIGLLVHGVENGGRLRVVTDPDGYREARSYLNRFHNRDAEMRDDVAAADADLPGLERQLGHVVLRHAGETRLVPDSHVDPDGTLLFDKRAFDDAYGRLVQPVFRELGAQAMEGASGDRVRALIVEAIMQGIPDGVRATAKFDGIPDLDGVHRYQKWSPVIVAGSESTLSLGLRSPPLANWNLRDVGVEKVGPASVYDEISQEAAPPTP